MAEAAPLPVLRFLDQAAVHRITMEILQLLHAFLRAPHVEVVIAGLPKRGSGGMNDFVRYVLLQHLQSYSERAALGFA